MFVTSVAFTVLCAALSSAASIPAPAQYEHFTRANNPNSRYSISKNITGHKFYDNFRFFDRPDPTDGLVEYLNLKEARKWNLTSADMSTFYLRGDATRTLKLGETRKSTRIESKWNIGNHVHILDLAHMPTGRGTWPAYWMVGPNWPNGGEIDIIEGANDIAPNLVTIHTTPGCTMEGMTNRTQTGKVKANDCNAYVNGNVGCGVNGVTGNDFGPKLNEHNGGYFAYQQTDDEVKVWFWKRYTAGTPLDVMDSHRKVVDPSKWGVPVAHFTSSNTCNLKEKLKPMKIVMNLTFCGGFAGHTFYPGGTPACEEWVRNNPTAFSEAYWKVYGLRIYEL